MDRSMALLQDIFGGLLHIIPIRQNSFIYESLSKFILQYYQHGLMAYLESKWFPGNYAEVDEDEAQVLTIGMLSAGFIVWLVCVLISCVVFLIEIIVKKIGFDFLTCKK